MYEIWLLFNPTSGHTACDLNRLMPRMTTIFNEIWSACSVTRFGEISPLCHNFKSFWAIFWMVYLVFGKFFYPLWHFYITGHIAIAVNGQRWNNNMAIWSHSACDRLNDKCASLSLTIKMLNTYNCKIFNSWYLERSVICPYRSWYTHRESMIKKSLDKLNTLGWC